MTATSFRELIDELGNADSSGLPLSDRPGRRVRWKARNPRDVMWALLLAAGAGLIIGGLSLAVQPPVTHASMVGATYTVGDLTLRRAGSGLYTGDVAVAITTDTRGTRASSSSIVKGRPFEGRCTVDPGGATQQCAFQLGTERITSVDRWTGDGWSRRYDDGETAIVIAPTPIPVPIPVGWRELH